MEAIDNLNNIGLDSDQKWAVATVIEEYASKLHQHQQEHDKLRQVADENMEEYTKRLIELTTLKSEYDKLKGEIEEVIDLNESVASDYNKVCNLHQQLLKEHAALKEKAEKMAEALESIASAVIPANDWENYSWIETARGVAAAALSSYNSNNKNENNG